MTSEIVTLFGGTGFVGRSVVRRLAKQGYRIRVGTRDSESVNRLKVCGDVGQIAPVNVDLLKPDTLEAALEKCDHVINLMGQLFEKGAMSFDLVHYQAPKLIAEYASKHKLKKFVHVSAIGADPNSDSKYARSKYAGEEAVRNAFPKATILRPSIVFGPDDQFFNRFAAMATYSPFLTVFDGGQTLMQPVFVGDVADAILKSLELKKHEGNLYELGGPSTYTFKDLMELTLSMSKRNRSVLSLPSSIGNLIATVAEILPEPPLTKDQIKLLKKDNVVCDQAKTLKDMGISATALETVVPDYLSRYQPGF